MSGLLALLDDVAAIAKVAAASVDDVIGQATKAGAKAAGAVIDDAAVTPKYVHGFAAERELPIVWKIARGSIFSKVVILLPVALLLSSFAPWAIAPLLMLGGTYLCYEGAEKVWHWLRHDDDVEKLAAKKAEGDDTAHLEEQKVRGAIKTDFILSAEIMTIALSALETDSVLFEAAALFVVALVITAMVYGAVALIVKADDIGLWLALNGRTDGGRLVGRAIVRGMPTFLRWLTIVGTAAMLWVGGTIIAHGLAGMGAPGLEHVIEEIAIAFSALHGAFAWLAEVALYGAFGVIVGSMVMSLAHRIVIPLLARTGLVKAGSH